LSTGERIRSSTGLAAWAGVIVTVIVLLLIAEGAHRYVEVPARKWIMHTARRVLGRSSARHAAAAKPAEPALPASTANEERVPSPVIRG
jgi:peptidoglycan/LPS O-acetylase OafA/YrhL